MARPDADPDIADQAEPDAAPPSTEADQVEPDPVAELEDRLRRALADADNARKRCERLVADVADRRAGPGRIRVAAHCGQSGARSRARRRRGRARSSTASGPSVTRPSPCCARWASRATTRPTCRSIHNCTRRSASIPDGDAPAGTVVQVVRPGYGEGTRQLRPAAVVVAGGSE